MDPDHYDPPAKAGGNLAGGNLAGSSSIATGFSWWFEELQTNYWL